jgi:prepilin-type processing-associated H-X9-DG protein
LYGASIAKGGMYLWNDMQLVTIARHGQRVATPPGTYNPKVRLPGAINMSFYDGHVQQVPLEELWQLYWHRNYLPPTKRPGLP